ncbi:hypothetical protein SAMN04488561_1905 [Jiangella alba]|uniref:Uncharacterized protein n=1 Tax=Jiangella alba TaxID=561176 RepID=A0A1H5K7N0_9ACTN|nr:hypothetical protein SAMN04488561_1905 [Jiangella alba]
MNNDFSAMFQIFPPAAARTGLLGASNSTMSTGAEQ